jgi:ADP-ribose pyrophosphatase YjhB (NUDIX family)
MSMPPDRPVFLVHASVAVMDGDRIMMVQEEKPALHGRWNLPGGHVDHGESPNDAAVREAREEVGLTLAMSGIVGIYTNPKSVRFVYRADGNGERPSAGDEILAVRWVALDDLLATPDDELVSPASLRLIVADLRGRKPMPLDLIRPVR